MLDDIAIIIVTYNGMKWIEECLTSCSNNMVIVVDNNSSDETVSFIKSRFSDVIILEQRQNLGFGRANNKGIKYALENNAEGVLLLNQDAYLKSNTLLELRKTSEMNKDFGIFSPIHLNGDGTKLDPNFSMYMNYNYNPNFYSDVLFQRLDKLYEIPFVNAAAWYIPKRTLISIGGFDPLFYHYGEDNHYCQRLQFHNLKIGIVTKGFVWHDRKKGNKINVENNLQFQLSLEERRFKIKFGNPNNLKIHQQWLHIKKSNYRDMILSLIKFRFKTFLEQRKLLKSRRLWFKECIDSRGNVMLLGSHYIYN